MLVFSGFGSMMSGKMIKDEGKVHSAATYALVIILGLIISYSAGLYPLIQRLMVLPFYGRMAMGVAVLFPLATAMGTPYPLGLRMVSKIGRENVLWMYAVNAAGSIIGSVAAMMLALSLGFRDALLIGGGFYLLALMTLPLIGRKFGD